MMTELGVVLLCLGAVVEGFHVLSVPSHPPPLPRHPRLASSSSSLRALVQPPVCRVAFRDRDIAVSALEGGGKDASSGEEEFAAMKEMILSLSRETDDAERRGRVASMFSRELAGVGEGDQPPRFAEVFSRALETVGTEVQEKARERQQSAEQHEDTTDRPKTAEEQQLWALIDMMVQSRVLVRNATAPPS
jgi:hypothetical protein